MRHDHQHSSQVNALCRGSGGALRLPAGSARGKARSQRTCVRGEREGQRPLYLNHIRDAGGMRASERTLTLPW